ncbi:hypothetical protein C8E99_1073 [Citricoccus muralis]|uniref:Lipoprotein n=2 Tax=Citricoccus muralis TaxID=169134 RepID=A0A3D9LC89_9MICC|nr:hypothetical protein C8E99_1073 [Citricoccus muralis]
MASRRIRNTFLGSTAVAAALLLTACGGGEAGTAEPGAASAGTISSPTTEPAAETGQQFDSLEAVFTAVDDELGCPAEASGDHWFMIEGEPTGLPGRTCGTNILIGWSEDPSKTQAALELVGDANGDVYAVQGPDWFVADVTDAAEATDMQVVEPQSTDLEAVAANLGASYQEL